MKYPSKTELALARLGLEEEKRVHPPDLKRCPDCGRLTMDCMCAQGVEVVA
jgi:hypothetical protein